MMNCRLRKNCQLVTDEYKYKARHLVWSKAYMQWPKNNITIDHVDPRREAEKNRKNWIRINIKAIPSFYGKFVKKEAKKEFRMKKAMKPQNFEFPPYLIDYCGFENLGSGYYELITP